MKKRVIKNKPLWSYRNVISSLLLLIALIFISVLLYGYSKNNTIYSSDVCIKYETITNGSKSTPIGTQVCTLSLETVDTEATREQGLSYRSLMPASRGMLFVFDTIGRQCIWMKDMHFNLDIIWLNAQGNVVKLAENVAPSTYPTSYCADNTFFVIEVNAHIAKSAGLTVGAHVNL